jgi:uncharacterized membrane protein
MNTQVFKCPGCGGDVFGTPWEAATSLECPTCKHCFVPAPEKRAPNPFALSPIHMLARLLIIVGVLVAFLLFVTRGASESMGMDVGSVGLMFGLCLFAILIGTILLVVDRLDRIAQITRQAEVERLEEKVERLNKLAEGGDWRK